MPPLTAVVTGGNQGIGLEIACLLAQRAGTRTVLTARSDERGRAAVEQVKKGAPAADVQYQLLELMDQDSVQRFADWAKSDLGQCDVLINNAGFAYKGNTFGAEEAKRTIDVNYGGTKAVTESLLGLIPPGGRIINICSSAGKLSIIRSPELRARFEQASSIQDLDALAAEFVQAIAAGRYQQEGWPGSMYGVSKLLQSMYTRILAEQHPKLQVNAVHPGYCSTSMSSFRGPQPASDGADTPVWLAFLPEGQGQTGKFFHDRQEQPW